MGHHWDALAALGAAATRFGLGTLASRPAAIKPAKLLELYEMEGCPFCRKVREALSVLDLEAMIYPCPKGGTRYRPKVVDEGGKAMFPYLVDPNTGHRMYESDEIVAYLFETYGATKAPLLLRAPVLNNTSTALASLWRLGRGLHARPSQPPQQPLELYSFESSPYARLVREVLCELEIAYYLHNVAKGGHIDWLPPAQRLQWAPDAPPTTDNRRAFVARAGRVQVPFLVDPNQGVEMFESADIVRYLNETYGA